MNSEERRLRDALVSPIEEATRLAEAYVRRLDDENNRVPDTAKPKTEARKDRNPRGVYEKAPGIWFIRYVDAQGRYRREKAPSKSAAIELYRKRKTEALMGKKLPEKLRRPTITFAEIARDALAFSKANKLSYRHDSGRMGTLLGWFREYPAESISAQDIERRFEKERWSPATANRYRALLSLPIGWRFATARLKRIRPG